jgi:hypothetical protein
VDEETLRIVLEAHNAASPALKKVTEDLKEVADQALRTQNAVKFALTGSKPRNPTTGRFESYKPAGSGSQQLNEAKRQVLEMKRLKEKADQEEENRRRAYIKTTGALDRQRVKEKEAEERQYFRTMSALDRQRLAEEKRNHEQYMRFKAAMDRQYLAEQAKQQAAAQAAQAKASQMRQSVMPNLMGGVGGMAAGVGRISGAVMELGGNLVRVGGMAIQFGKNVLDGVVHTLQEVGRWGAVGVATIVGVGLAVGKAGVDFNEFKENTIKSLRVMLKSTEQADKVFKHAFRVSIPAKYEFQEVLEGFRTMEAFGIKTTERFAGTKRTAGELAVALGQMMEKPLAQVTRFLGNLSQGRLLLQQAAPLAMGRPTLEAEGVKFDSHGSPEDRSKLIAAAFQSIDKTVGNILEEMANTYESKLDSMVSMSKMYAGRITEGLFGQLTDAYGKVADFFEKLLESQDPAVQKLTQTLRTPFDILGSLVEKAAEQLPRLAESFGSVFSEENIINGLSEVLALFQVIRDDVMAFVEHASNGKGLVGIWEFFKQSALTAINLVMEAWGGFTGAMQFIVDKGPEIWKALTDGAQTLIGLLETMVGLMALNFGAQVVGGTLQIAGGLLKVGAALKNINDLVKGGTGVWDAIAKVIGGGGTAAAGAASQTATTAGVGVGARVGAFMAGVGGTALGVAGTVVAGVAGGNALSEWDDRRKGRSHVSFGDAVGEMGLNPWYKPGDREKAAIAEMQKNRPGKPGGSRSALSPGIELHGSSIPGMGAVQGVGKWAIGAATGAAGGLVPDSLKDLGGQFAGYVNRGRANAPRWGEGKHADYAGQNRAMFRGMVGDARKTRPDTFKGGELFDLDRAMEAMGGRDPKVLDAMIKAYESSGKGFDTEDKALHRKGALPLYQERLKGEQGVVRENAASVQANEQLMRSATSVKDFQKAKVEYEKSILAYWESVDDANKTGSTIFEINREAGDAAVKKQKEARKKLLDQAQAQQELSEAGSDAVRAWIETLPASEQAAAAAQNLIPRLQAEQQAIIKKWNVVEKGTKESAKIEQEYHNKQKAIIDARNQAADAAAQQAFDAPKRQFGTLKKLIGMLPKGAQKGAMKALLLPRIQATMKAAQQERDPEKRQEKLLEVADMYSELKESRKSSDPFQGMFDKAMAGDRSQAIAGYRRAILGGKSNKSSRIGRQKDIFGAMSPFAPGGVGGGNQFGGDKFNQLIFNLPANASDKQIADLVLKVVSEQINTR